MDFFEQLSTFLADRQQMKFDAKKIGEDLVLMITPDAKGTGKIFNITIPKEDLIQGIDVKIFEALKTPTSNAKADFQVNETDASEKEEEDEHQYPEGSEKGRAQAKKKKEEAKKAAPSKKATVKKGKVEKKTEVTEEKTPPQQLELLDEKGRAIKTKRGSKKAPDVTKEPEQIVQATDPVPSADEILEAQNKMIFDLEMAAAALSIESKEYSKAIESYIKALELFPDSEEAKTGKEMAIEADQQERFDSWITGGKGLMANKDFMQAIHHFKQALEILPDSSIAKESLELAEKKLEAFNLLNS